MLQIIPVNEPKLWLRFFYLFREFAKNINFLDNRNMSPIESIESSLYGIEKIPEHISIHPIYEEQFMNELNTLI